MICAEHGNVLPEYTVREGLAPAAGIAITGLSQLPAPAQIALAAENFLPQGPRLLGGTLTQALIKAYFLRMRDEYDRALRLA